MRGSWPWAGTRQSTRKCGTADHWPIWRVVAVTPLRLSSQKGAGRPILLALAVARISCAAMDSRTLCGYRIGAPSMHWRCAPMT